MADYVEITFTSDPESAIASLAKANVKLTSHLFDSDTHRIVVDEKYLSTVKKLVPNITCIAPVAVVAFNNRPGGLHEILEAYKGVNIVSTYPADNNRLILRLFHFCSN